MRNDQDFEDRMAAEGQIVEDEEKADGIFDRLQSLRDTERIVAKEDASEQLAQTQWELSKVDAVYLIESLYNRGTTIKDIFARYYEFDVMSNHPIIDVEDAELAGMADTVINPIDRQPF